VGIFSDIIDGHRLPVTCPNCDYVTDVPVREARLEGAVLCAGCRTTVRFVEDGMTRGGLREVRRAEERLARTLESINRSGWLNITIGRGRR
jgi:hypothetical protein